MRKEPQNLATLKSMFNRSHERLHDYKAAPLAYLSLSFSILFFIGVFSFINQLEHFWLPTKNSDYASVYVELNVGSSNIVELKSSTGFFGRWERGSNSFGTMQRLSKHLNHKIFQRQLIIALLKKPDLVDTKIYFHIEPGVTYSDFSPVLTALQKASINQYLFL